MPGPDHRSQSLCRAWLAPYLTGLLLLSTAATATPTAAIYGNWSFAPEETARVEAQAQEARRAEGKKKPSRKERKRAKKRAKQRASIMPAILRTPALQILQQGDSRIALIPQQGTKLVVQTTGRAPSLSLSDWGKSTPQTVGFSTWEGDSLVIETTPRQGLHIIHSYHVNNRGHLVQGIELYDGLDAHTQHRIFTRKGKIAPATVPTGGS